MRVINNTTGEAELVDEKGHTTHLLFDAQAIHQIESRLDGQSAVDIITSLGQKRPTLAVTAAIIMAGHAGWQRRNGRGGRQVTPTSAVQIVDDCGGLAEVLPVLAESMSRSRTLGLVKEDEGRAEDEEPFGLDFEKEGGADARPPGHGNGASETPPQLASLPGASGP